jgi:hypothetical protein
MEYRPTKRVVGQFEFPVACSWHPVCAYTEIIMPERSKTRDPRPRDPNQRAFEIIMEATGQPPKTESPAEPFKNPHAVALGHLGGLKGGIARAAPLGPRKRSRIAAKAAKAR